MFNGYIREKRLDIAAFVCYNVKLVMSMDFKILNDLNDDIIAIRHEAFVIGRGVPVEVELDGRDNLLTHFCMYDKSTLVSYLRAEDMGDGLMHIGRVATKGSERGKGHGRVLFDFVFNYAKENGFKFLEVSAVHTAVGFYEKLGFVSEGDYYLETGVNHIYMKKIL